MTSEQRKTHIPILSWGIPVVVYSSSCPCPWGTAIASIRTPSSGAWQPRLRHSDGDEDHAQDERRADDDPQALALESQVHEVQRHERRLDRREADEPDDQQGLLAVRQDRGVRDLDGGEPGEPPEDGHVVRGLVTGLRHRFLLVTS